MPINTRLPCTLDHRDGPASSCATMRVDALGRYEKNGGRRLRQVTAWVAGGDGEYGYNLRRPQEYQPPLAAAVSRSAVDNRGSCSQAASRQRHAAQRPGSARAWGLCGMGRKRRIKWAGEAWRRSPRWITDGQCGAPAAVHRKAQHLDIRPDSDGQPRAVGGGGGKGLRRCDLWWDSRGAVHAGTSTVVQS